MEIEKGPIKGNMVMEEIDDKKPRRKMESCEQNEDLISALPDSLIHRILSFLPSTKEAVKTGVLSKRWYLEWTNVHNLIFEFDSHHDGIENLERLARFVDSSLALHSCSFIDSFILRIYTTDEVFLNDRLPLWVNFAIAKQAKFITLDFFDNNFVDHHILPCSVFINNSVVEMKIRCCHFESFDYVNWKSLKVLCMEKCQLDNENLECILLGSPSLESLEMHECSGFNQLHFGSKCLKRFVLRQIGYGNGEEPLSSLDISSPYLETLELLTLYNKWPNLSLPSLICATLDFEIEFSRIYTVVNFVRKILRQVQHALELKLGTWCLQVLSLIEVRGKGCPSLSTKRLAVNAPCFAVDLPGITILLRRLPELEKLTVKLEDGESSQFENLAGNRAFNKMVEEYWTAYKMSSKPLLHLKTVEIIGLLPNFKGYELVLEFIDFLRKNVGVLSHMIIDKHECTMDFITEVSAKLLSMPRSCPNVRGVHGPVRCSSV